MHNKYFQATQQKGPHGAGLKFNFL